jgi:hypothetical protein
MFSMIVIVVTIFLKYGLKIKIKNIFTGQSSTAKNGLCYILSTVFFLLNSIIPCPSHPDPRGLGKASLAFLFHPGVYNAILTRFLQMTL